VPDSYSAEAVHAPCPHAKAERAGAACPSFNFGPFPCCRVVPVPTRQRQRPAATAAHARLFLLIGTRTPSICSNPNPAPAPPLLSSPPGTGSEDPNIAQPHLTPSYLYLRIQPPSSYAATRSEFAKPKHPRKQSKQFVRERNQRRIHGSGDGCSPRP